MTVVLMCFACDRIVRTPELVTTWDGQTVYVGRDCYRRVAAAGESGYQPPKGGPKLYLLVESNSDRC